MFHINYKLNKILKILIHNKQIVIIHNTFRNNNTNMYKAK
jgi:hypothetical protein